MSRPPLPYSNKGDLTNGSIPKHLLRLSVPMVWALFAIISVQLVDTYFVAQLGKTELAGMSFTFPVTMLISHLVFGFNVAMSSVIARLIGERKTEDVKRVTLHGIFFAFTASAIIAFITWIFLDDIFIMIGVDETTMPVIHDYMPLWLLGSTVLAIPVNGNSSIRATGDTFSPALVMISIALINLVLAPVMIFGWFGFPALGVFGAALATFISYLCGMAFGLYLLIVVKKLMPQNLHLDELGDSFKRLAVIAIPAGLTNIIGPITNGVIVSVLATYGTEAVAAFGVVTRVEAISLLFVIALALGMSPIVGQNWGAEKYDRVHKAIFTAIGVNFIWSFTIAAIFGLFAREIGHMFSSDETVIHYVTLFFWMVPVTYAFGNLVFGWSSAFNAMGQPEQAFIMIAAKCFVITLPAILIGSHFYGVPGIFMGIALSNVIAGSFFHAHSWRRCMRQEKARQSTEVTAF